MKPWSGVIGEDGVEVQQVAAVEVSSASFRFLTSRHLHVYEFAWAPDSSKIVFVAAKPPGENNWWVARLYVKNAGTGGPDSLAGGRAAACKTPQPNLSCNYLDESDIALPQSRGSPKPQVPCMACRSRFPASPLTANRSLSSAA